MSKGNKKRKEIIISAWTLEKYVKNWIAIAAPFQGIGRILGNGGKVIASDLSPVAVAVAANNVQRYCLQGRVCWIKMRFLIVTVRMKRMMMLGRIASLIPKRRVGFHLCFRGITLVLDHLIWKTFCCSSSLPRCCG
jgi:hypothetical protein